MAVDTKTRLVYLCTAEYGPATEAKTGKQKAHNDRAEVSKLQPHISKCQKKGEHRHRC